MPARALRDPEQVRARLGRLREPHVAPLTDFVERLRASRGRGEAVPWFDPADAGVHARVLLLYEAPGARAVGPGSPRPPTDRPPTDRQPGRRSSARPHCWLCAQERSIATSTVSAAAAGSATRATRRGS